MKKVKKFENFETKPYKNGLTTSKSGRNKVRFCLLIWKTRRIWAILGVGPGKSALWIDG